MQNEPIVIERTFNAPVKEVWKAITDKNDMKQWYFDFESFIPEAGFQFHFMGGKDERQYLHLCQITEAIPNKKLAYSWRYDGYEGNSIVTFELSEDGNNTNIKLRHTGLDTFPKNNPDFDRQNFVEGWTYIIGTSLKTFLEAE